MASIAHVRGSIVGAAILTLFGCIWCVLALAFWTLRPSWAIPAGCLATIALLGWCGQRLMALRGMKSNEDAAAAAKGKRAGILFGIIFGTEGLLIGACSGLLARLGLGVWIPIAAAAIVGLHFIPLAHLFEVRIYYWTGAVSVFAMAGCFLIRDASTRQLCAGLIMAAVLWLTAVVVLLQARRPQPALK